MGVSRVLIVGGSGLLGQYLFREALLRHHETVVTHRGESSRGSPETRIPLELADPTAIARAVTAAKPDVVLNAAALTDVDGCEKRPTQAGRINAAAVGDLARAAARVGADFVHASTDYVFDGSGPAGEETPPNPLSVYGRTKLEGEHLALESHPDALVLRLSAVFGWNRLSGRSNSVTWILTRLESGLDVPLFQDQRITPTYAETAAAAAFDLWEQKRSGLYHVACKDCLSRVEMGREVAEVFGQSVARLRAIPMASVSLLAPRPRAPCLIVRKIEETLKRAMPSLRECLEDMKATR